MPGYNSQPMNGHESVDPESFMAYIEAEGIRMLGIRWLPAVGDELETGKELWRIEKLVKAEGAATDELPEAVRSKLERFRELGHHIDHVITGAYIGRTDAGADQHWGLELSYFGFLHARPNLNVGIMYNFGGAEPEASNSQ